MIVRSKCVPHWPIVMPGIAVEPRLVRVAVEDEAVDAAAEDQVALGLERVGSFSHLPCSGAAVNDSAPTNLRP